MQQVSVINNSIFLDLIEKAHKSERKRVMYCLHKTDDNMLHTMINVILKKSYVAPHKHWLESDGGLIKKGESYTILEGEAKILLFDDIGNVTQSIKLAASEQTMALIPEGVWHTIIALSEHIVIFENKTGPWIEGQDKVFHPEFPKEGESGMEEYLKAWSL